MFVTRLNMILFVYLHEVVGTMSVYSAVCFGYLILCGKTCIVWPYTHLAHYTQVF